jgi:hypothetical protein
MCEQAVTAGDIDDAPAAKEPPHAARGLPRFVQLLSRQAAGMTHRSGHAIEDRMTGKPIEVAIGEPVFR